MTQGRYTVHDIRQRVQQDFYALIDRIDGTDDWVGAASMIFNFRQEILILLSRQKQLQEQDNGYCEACYEAEGKEILDNRITTAFAYSLKLLHEESNETPANDYNVALSLIDEAQIIRQQNAESLGTSYTTEDLEFARRYIESLIARNQTPTQDIRRTYDPETLERARRYIKRHQRQNSKDYIRNNLPIPESHNDTDRAYAKQLYHRWKHEWQETILRAVGFTDTNPDGFPWETIRLLKESGFYAYFKEEKGDLIP